MLRELIDDWFRGKITIGDLRQALEARILQMAADGQIGLESPLVEFALDLVNRPDALVGVILEARTEPKPP